MRLAIAVTDALANLSRWDRTDWMLAAAAVAPDAISWRRLQRAADRELAGHGVSNVLAVGSPPVGGRPGGRMWRTAAPNAAR